MAENLYGYGLDFENPYGRNTTGHTGKLNDVFIKEENGLEHFVEISSKQDYKLVG